MFIWDDLKHFLAFARGGSIVAAAKAQRVNHSTVYRRIAPLATVVAERESELVRVSDKIPELVTHFYLLVHKDMQRTPRVRAFFDFFDSEIKAFRAVLIGSDRSIPQEKLPASSVMGPQAS
jgi:DNA-binding transcriptional LysR family regulator